MLVLVVSDNFLQLFFGWEGVGLCSYLLIGFWYKKDTANQAAIKAFLVNRVGDFGFAIGIFLIFIFFGSLNYNEVFQSVPDLALKEIYFLGFDINLITQLKGSVIPIPTANPFNAQTTGFDFSGKSCWR